MAAGALGSPADSSKIDVGVRSEPSMVFEIDTQHPGKTGYTTLRPLRHGTNGPLRNEPATTRDGDDARQCFELLVVPAGVGVESSAPTMTRSSRRSRKIASG